MLNLILKIRDKSWYYTNQLYLKDTEESNLKDFKLRFSLFFLPPILLLIGSTGWLCSVVFNRPYYINPNNYSIVIPIGIVPTWLFWRGFTLIFNKLSVYPFDSKHDAGYFKNRLFIGTMIISELLITFGTIFILFDFFGNS